MITGEKALRKKLLRRNKEQLINMIIEILMVNRNLNNSCVKLCEELEVLRKAMTKNETN